MAGIEKGPTTKKKHQIERVREEADEKCKSLVWGVEFCGASTRTKNVKCTEKKTKVTASKNLKTESLSRKLSRCSYVS